MNACLENIVSIKGFCGSEAKPSLSGYDLMDAPEVTISSLADFATEKYVTAKEVAKKSLSRAILEVTNDFLAVLVSNRVGVSLLNPEHYISKFDTTKTNLPTALERGIIWYKSKSLRGVVKKARITEVQVYPLADVESIYLNIYDNGNAYRYNVSLVANQLNSFAINHVMEGPSVKVTFDNSDFATASSYLNCSCDGSLPEGLGIIQGWNGSTSVGREGFGINLKVGYFCDYDQILCDLSKVYIGELIYMKARWMLLEENLKSNRFEYIVTKDRKQTMAYMQDIDSQYREKWNLLLGAMPELLKKYNDNDCITCRGIRWVANI